MKGNSKNNTKIKVKVGLVCINAAKVKAKRRKAGFGLKEKIKRTNEDGSLELILQNLSIKKLLTWSGSIKPK